MIVLPSEVANCFVAHHHSRASSDGFPVGNLLSPIPQVHTRYRASRCGIRDETPRQGESNTSASRIVFPDDVRGSDSRITIFWGTLKLAKFARR